MWSLVFSFLLHVIFLLENLDDMYRDYLSAVFDFPEYNL